MGRVKKEFNKDGVFQIRFREQYYKSHKTQEQLAKALEVSRPTVSGWLDGKNIPNILVLEKMARLFNVSADYLLGLCDAESPDISKRAAAEYTGLSEQAVELLHNGIDDFECEGEGISQKEQKANQITASEFIQSGAFNKILHYLKELLTSAYAEKIMTKLHDEYSDCDPLAEESDFKFARGEDRKVVENNLIYVYKIAPHFEVGPLPDAVYEMDDEELLDAFLDELYYFRRQNELNQFHATKALTGYIDEVISRCHENAGRRFTAKQ